MFKTNELQAINPKHFGVGSYIELQRDQTWLVVQTAGNSIGLVNLTTFKLENLVTSVIDPNFFTLEEARRVVDIVGDIHNSTFTDFTLNSRGIKNA